MRWAGFALDCVALLLTTFGACVASTPSARLGLALVAFFCGLEVGSGLAFAMRSAARRNR